MGAINGILMGVYAVVIYGAPTPLPHDFKIWRTTLQGNGSDGHILFSCEKMSLSVNN